MERVEHRRRAGKGSLRDGAEQAYAKLRREIRELRLSPGAKLRLDALEDQFELPAGAIRHALSRLAKEALIDIYPQNASFVAPLRGQDVLEGIFIRRAFEVQAAMRAAQTRDGALIAALEVQYEEQAKALADGALRQFRVLDEAMHALLCSNNLPERCLHLLDVEFAVRDRLSSLANFAVPEEPRARATLAEHRAILDGVASGDPEAAAHAMRTHLVIAQDVWEQRLKDTGLLEPLPRPGRGHHGGG